MRLLIVDPAGNGLDFAMRAQRDGHDVRHCIRQTEKTKHIGKGLVTLVDDYRKWVRWRQEGVKVVGASIAAAAWELDRVVGMKVLKKHGIDVPPYKEFTDYDSA